MYHDTDSERRINWSAVLTGLICFVFVLLAVQFCGHDEYTFQRGEMVLMVSPIVTWMSLGISAVGTAACLPRPEFHRNWIGLRLIVVVLSTGFAVVFVLKQFDYGGAMVLPDSWATSQVWWSRLFVDRTFLPYVTLHALLVLRLTQILCMTHDVYRNIVLHDVFMLVFVAGLFLAVLKFVWAE